MEELLISLITYPFGNTFIMKISDIPEGSIIVFNATVFFRCLHKDDMDPAWISEQGQYLTDEALENLVSDSGATPILTSFSS